jgi:hypothetical protein
MDSTAAAAASPLVREAPESGVSLARLYVLRAAYLLIAVGLGATNLPGIVNHDLTARGALSSLLGGVWLLSFLGLRYPLRMLPLLMFEFVWKTTWLLAFGLPQWFAGRLPPTFPEDFQAIVLGVVLMPIVIPWGYVYRRYVRQPGARWR